MVEIARRGMWITIVILAIFGILFVWHFFLYFSTVRFFGITGRGGRGVVALAYLLLLGSLFASMLVVRRLDGSFAGSFYTVSMLWIGVGLALLLFFMLAWAGWGLSRFHNPRPGMAVFGWAAVLATCLYSAYGIWNASHPRVK